MTDTHDHLPPQDAALENSPIIASSDMDESAQALAGSAIC